MCVRACVRVCVRARVFLSCQVESSQNMIRIVGLSATLPNYKDVSDGQHSHCTEHRGCTNIRAHILHP